MHNQGQYARASLNTKFAYRPTEKDLPFLPRTGDDRLIDHEVIPLSFEMVDKLITELLDLAARVEEALG